MRELLNLFTETESRDELGIGQVRDAFSDLLFPGTSTLHTRAKYLLFVPWCYQDAERRGLRGQALVSRVDASERRLLVALQKAGETDGLIGRLSGAAVKTLPSAIYWSALGVYGIRTAPSALTEAVADSDGIVEADELAERGQRVWSPTLPPAPAGFPERVDGGFTMTGAEASWLQERMIAGASGSMLAHLLRPGYEPDSTSDTAWDDSACQLAPNDVADDLRDAELFSLAMHGAALLYNLQIAELYSARRLTRVPDPVAAYRFALDDWVVTCRRTPALRTWDRQRMWTRVCEANPRIARNLVMRTFVNRWLDAVGRGMHHSPADNRGLRSLVASREESIKRAQSRLHNEKLLRTWSGASGSRRLTYRWSQVKRLLHDVHEGLRGADAAA